MSNNSPEKLVKAIHRRTRRKYSAEEKIRIVLQGLRGEDSIAELCRREGLNQNIYYRQLTSDSGPERGMKLVQAPLWLHR